MGSGAESPKNWERWVVNVVIVLAIVGTCVGVVEGGVDPVPVVALDALLLFAMFG